MDNVIRGFLKRNLPEFENSFNVKINGSSTDYFVVTAQNGVVNVTANNYVSAFHGIYCYLKKYCNLQFSWCGNRKINIDKLVMFSGEYKKMIHQKFRVYMNYCTLNYSMCWWDFERWEKEIDFMAMNGINMPLAVVGSEAVLYETLLELGLSKEDALSSVSGPAFWAWQLMTNIMGYIPPKNEKYVYERLELGRKILNRYVEFGMYPIQQGFSGHVPVKLKEKYPNVNILMQRGWCGFPKMAQIDPLDPFFRVYGFTYLNKLKELMGCYHYIACDPFHEGTPPKKTKRYLNAVGKTISSLYTEFDSKSIWVMQAWTMRKHIVQAVDKDKLLILDLNSSKTPANDNMWGYPVVSGMLHNFGGKNAMQGKLELHCKNRYYELKNAGANVVGTGMFMEGIEQNPVVYDLQFELLTADKPISLNLWLNDYIARRYGRYDERICRAWGLLLRTCYKSDGYEENAVGSTLASRPQMIPVMTGPCCFAKVFYDTAMFEQAVREFASAAEDFKNSDGYQYDLCDLTRQLLSNRFYTNQLAFAKAYKKKDISAVQNIADKQRALLNDIDNLTSYRSEMCLSRWVCDAQNLASDEEEKRYFDFNARTLITLWGDINDSTSALYDYSWREWSGLIKKYYYPRWDMFYNEAVSCLKRKKKLKIKNGNNYVQRENYLKYDLGRKIGEFELDWAKQYEEYDYPVDKNVVPFANELIEKYIKR